jgi:starch-binding outer membrane protein, SusD/RagB family
MPYMRKLTAALAGVVILCSSACKEGLSAPSQDAVVAGSAQPLQNLVTGILATDRGQGSATSNLLFPETMARNVAYITTNEPRFINELIGVPIDNSDFIGSSGWTAGYQVARASNQLLTGPTLAAAPAGDQLAVRGLIQTIKALDYIREVQLRDSLGAVIQSNDASAVDPMRTKTAVLAYISAVLDSGYTSLTAAGVDATMPINLPSGYKVNGDYGKTANVALFNRGLAGEVNVMRGFDHQSPCAACFASAITALNIALASSGATPSATQLAAGPYYEYNPSAPESFGDPMVDVHNYLTVNFVNSIQAGDLRSAKIVKAAAASSNVSGLQLTFRDPITDPTVTANLTRPIPIRRNADFYLFRAQAEAESGNLAGATADVNAVRVAEGGLAPLATFANTAAARTAILYEMRYSLVYEGPFHLQALREYGALTRAYVAQAGMPTLTSDPAHANDPLQTVIPIPSGEVAARGGNVTPQP